MKFDWQLVVSFLYGIILVATAARIIMDNKNPLKTHSYLLLIIVLPVIGIIVYYFFGVNLRKEKLFVDKEKSDQAFIVSYLKKYESDLIFHRPAIKEQLQGKARLPYLFLYNSQAVFTMNNTIEYLFGGEEKFPALLSALKNAQHYIHVEYYIFFANDNIGRQIIDILCHKAKNGVEVRLLLDGFGSKISGKVINRLRSAGVEMEFFRRLRSLKYFTKSNFRDHRKIVIVDGITGFVGGINVADYYINKPGTKHYWADLHCMLKGDAVYSLQLFFYLNWRFATGRELIPLQSYLPPHKISTQTGISIMGSSATSKAPGIMDAYFSMITTAVDEVLITTPYFIPNEAILEAIKVTAKSGVSVKILLPESSDGYFVQKACLSYVQQLLENNVKVYFYKKGMIHSKYMVIDGTICTMGTANMDERSFNINAEINAFIFNEAKSKELKYHFESDLLLSEEITLIKWKQRSGWKKVQESLFRLVAPLL